MTPDPSTTQNEKPPEGKTAHKPAWHEHIPRTTAALAVLAAVSSGQYTNQFSRTILSQAEVTDKWSYYQAKKIKQHLTQNQVDLSTALSAGHPDVAAQLADLQQRNATAAKKYDTELATITAEAKALEADKLKHEQQGERFQFAFVILQAGVVLSTVAASARRRELWIFAIVCGVLGLLVAADGYFLLDLKLRPPPPVSTSPTSAGG